MIYITNIGTAKALVGHSSVVEHLQVVQSFEIVECGNLAKDWLSDRVLCALGCIVVFRQRKGCLVMTL
jgi:hypothetical protein